MGVGLFARWWAMHGAPRAYTRFHARRGDPLSALIGGPDRGGDPYPLMERIRAKGPLVRTQFTWVSVDHAICRDVLRDKRFGVTPPSEMDLPRPLRALIARTDPKVANPVEPPAMVIVDPPEHTHYRQLVAKSFTPRAIAGLESRVAEVTRALIDRLETSPAPDLIADFATELPVVIIAELLDLPADVQPRMLRWGHDAAPLLDVGIGWRTYRRAIDSLRDADQELRERFAELRGGRHGASPFSRLAADGALNAHEFTANAALLIGAGFETTVNLIGNGIVALLRHPDQLERLRDDPSLWPNAIEELLRFDSPVQLTARTARCDIELAGRHIRAGEMVTLLLGGANRDPGVFVDADRLDVGRDNAREHLAFASGIHVCLGAPLARIEGITALRALFESFPGLRLTAGPEPRGLVNLRGYARLQSHLGERHAVTATVS